jgi:hypothetical protein
MGAKDTSGENGASYQDMPRLRGGLPPDRAKVGRPKDPQKSRLTNAPVLLANVDGRTSVARRYRDIATAIATDQGGADRLSETRLQLIRRFSAAACLAEQLESRLARGEEIDIQEHSLLVSTMVRVAQRIGIDRRAQNITPSLSEYLTPQEAAD